MPLTDGSLSSKASWGRIRSWWTSVVQHPFSQRLPASLLLPVPTHLHKTTTDTQTHKLGSAPSPLFLSSTYLSFYLMCVCISIHVLGALHMNITRWSTLKSDWLYSLQPKKEKLCTVSKIKTRKWLWLRSWTPIVKVRLKLKKEGKSLGHSYDLNQIPYDYIVKVMNRFKGLVHQALYQI